MRKPQQKKSQKPASSDAEQSKRFIETAKEVGADQDEKALERALKKIAPLKSGSLPKRS